MKMKCIIVDDEPLARSGLKAYVDNLDFVECIGEAENALELDVLLSKAEVDLVFLDIQMPVLSGLDFLKITRNRPMIVITTAFPQYALEGFEYDVVDYLVKPITFNRFFKAVKKARELHLLKQNKQLTEENGSKSNFIFVKADGKYEKIFFEDILYVQAVQNYISIVTHSKKYLSLLTLKSIAENMDSTRFIQVHKSFIVSIEKIRRIEPHEITIGNHQIPVSRSFKENVIRLVRPL